jgi:DNA polymerase-3 subunit delta'
METQSTFTFNWPFFGNAHIIDFLQRGIANERLTHCYVFAGPRNVGKSSVARQFAASLLCEHFSSGRGALPCGECAACRQFSHNRHSDAVWLERAADKKNISVEQVREFIRVMHMGTFMGQQKVGIVRDADTLSIEAANALLKTLEEPSGKVTMILLTALPESLPMTILSRAQVLRFLPAPAGDIYDYLVREHKVGRDVSRRLSRLCLGRPALAVKLWEDKDFFSKATTARQTFFQLLQAQSSEQFSLIANLLKQGKDSDARTQAAEILEWWQVALRDVLLTRAGVADVAAGEGADAVAPESVPLGRIMDLASALRTAEAYLQANVQPAAALESVALR